MNRVVSANTPTEASAPAIRTLQAEDKWRDLVTMRSGEAFEVSVESVKKVGFVRLRPVADSGFIFYPADG